MGGEDVVVPLSAAYLAARARVDAIADDLSTHTSASKREVHNLYVGTADRDVIIYAGGGHGLDPTSDDFGAIRFAAETGKPGLGGSAHGSYFDPSEREPKIVGAPL